MSHPAPDSTRLTEIEVVDRVLEAHARVLGNDLPGYRNHVYRVINFCVRLAGVEDDACASGKIAVAAVHHDLGIWTHGTFDYLSPSVDLARAHLAETGLASWDAEVTAMILEHHRVRSYGGPGGTLVEPFRRADWVDVTAGLCRFGVPRREVRGLYAIWPSAGFHARLVHLTWTRARTHPWSPLPMLRF